MSGKCEEILGLISQCSSIYMSVYQDLLVDLVVLVTQFTDEELTGLKCIQEREKQAESHTGTSLLPSGGPRGAG